MTINPTIQTEAVPPDAGEPAERKRRRGKRGKRSRRRGRAGWTPMQREDAAVHGELVAAARALGFAPAIAGLLAKRLAERLSENVGMSANVDQ